MWGIGLVWLLGIPFLVLGRGSRQYLFTRK
jgi:hypothetical protein